MAWSGIHISRAPWLFVCIIQCTQRVCLQSMCVDELVIKMIGGVKIHYHHGIQWWWNPFIGTWYLLCLVQILYQIFLWYCMFVLTWNQFSLNCFVGKLFHLRIINVVLFTHGGGVCKWEEVRVSLGLYYDTLDSFLWPWLGRWVSVGLRWLLPGWYSIWWLGCFLFGFPLWPLLVLVLMAILKVVGVFLLRPLLWFHDCVIMTCLVLLCS